VHKFNKSINVAFFSCLKHGFTVLSLSVTKAPFICEENYKERLLLANKLDSISYWHEFLDIVFKAINGLIYIDNDVLPALSEANSVLAQQ